MDNALLTYLTSQRQKTQRSAAQDSHERRMNEKDTVLLTYRGVQYKPANLQVVATNR